MKINVRILKELTKLHLLDKYRALNTFQPGCYCNVIISYLLYHLIFNILNLLIVTRDLKRVNERKREEIGREGVAEDERVARDEAGIPR